jgi:ParB-like chromosome segregation protein Spo0J
MKIIETNDYSIFKLDVNRVKRILPKHLDRLSNVMKKNGWLEGSAIIVDENFNLIDGYYRFFAAKTNSMSLRYVVVSVEYSEKIIRELNCL